MRRPELGAAALAVALLLPGAASSRSYELHYGFAPGQVWHGVQSVFRKTTVAGSTQTDRDTARFRYVVGKRAPDGAMRLDARMLSQTRSGRKSPFDFSVIHFVARVGRQGALRGMYFELGEADPPDLDGVKPDPVAFRQMLRSVAAAWVESVYWFPELPAHPLEPGESFVVNRTGDVGGTDPGVSMRQDARTTYTLRKVSGHLAEFSIRVTSRIDAATAQTGIRSRRDAEGEATFDLDLGMWTRQQIRSENRATVRGVPGTDQASAHTVTTIEMALGEPPSGEKPEDRVGL